MEHRHSPRKPINLNAKLITHEGNCYPVNIIEISAMGMRVMVNEKLPDNVKLVDLQIQIPENKTSNNKQSLKMLITRRQGRVLGLCLFDEQERIPVSLGASSKKQPRKNNLLAISHP